MQPKNFNYVIESATDPFKTPSKEFKKWQRQPVI